MSVKGFVRIEKKNVNGDLIEVIEKENLIVANFYTSVLGWYANIVADKIFISSNTEPPNFNIGSNQLPNMVDGITPTGITSPIYIDSVVPNFAQYQAQFAPPTTTRTFQTVGLREYSSGLIKAYLLLDVPCIQDNNEFLDVFYRIQFTNTGNTLPDNVINNFGRAISVNNPYSNWFHTAYYFDKLSPSFINKYNKLWSPSASLIDESPGGGNSGTNYWSSGQVIASHFKWKQLASFIETQQVGKIISQTLHGYDSRTQSAYYVDKTNNPQPIQSFFSHNSNADKPFFDSLNLASGNGTIALAGTWTGKYPELYKISITKNGVTGVAEYKWSVRKWLGFDGNTYTDLLIPCPYLNPIAAAATNIHGWREENNDKLKYSNTQIVQYDSTGITLLDILNGEYTTWNATSTPSLPVTQLRQCAVDITNKKIYCACRSTGIWIIDIVANTITHPVTSPCYGIDVGYNNIAYGVIASGIVKSSNWSTVLPVNISNWSSVQFIKVDPSHINEHIAIVIDRTAIDPNNPCQIKWWKGNTQTTIDGVISNVKNFPASLEVSDTGSVWAILGYTLEFNTINVTSVDTILTSTNTGYYKIDFISEYLTGSNRLRDKNNNIITSYTAFPNSPYSLHMSDGIVLTAAGLRQLFTDNQYCWKNYGWNGTLWIEGNTNSKLTHTNPQALGNGITIAFQNGSQSPHWVSTDYYTFAAANALVKDNTTTYYLDFSWYSAPALFNQPFTATIPASLELTLPCASDPSFITLEVNSPHVHEFKINNVLVALVRNDNTLPAPNEVTISADGKVKFNSADIGKTFTAKYAYVKI